MIRYPMSADTGELYVGKEFTVPRCAEVDPATMQSTGRLQVFRVTGRTAYGWTVEIVHGRSEPCPERSA